MASELRVFAVPGIPEAVRGTDPGGAIADAIARAGLDVRAGDVFVVAQKFISKAEGAVIALREVVPSPRARAWAAAWGKEAAVVEVVLRESRRIVRMERGVIVSETKHGLICANAGVDASNVAAGFVSLLPDDPDASAARVRDVLATRFDCPVGVIVSDTFGRPWREGAVNVAVGIAGLRPVLDLRGGADQFGRRLQSTTIAVADEIAAAAELVMGKAKRTPAVVVRGADEWTGDGTAAQLLRPAAMDLFR